MDDVNEYTSRRLYALLILKPLSDRFVLLLLHRGLILLVIEYCSPVIFALLYKDERIQYRAHIIISQYIA